MKLYALLPAILAVTIAPILPISLPAQSQQTNPQTDAGTVSCDKNPGIAGCNLRPTDRPPNPIQPDQIISFGVLQSNQSVTRPQLLTFTVPGGHFRYQITPESIGPFKVSSNSGSVSNNNRDVVVVISVRDRPAGIHQQLIRVKTGPNFNKTIKTVLLKVTIPAAVQPPSNNPQPQQQP
jgi:hypothetical protein